MFAARMATPLMSEPSWTISTMRLQSARTEALMASDTMPISYRKYLTVFNVGIFTSRCGATREATEFTMPATAEGGVPLTRIS